MLAEWCKKLHNTEVNDKPTEAMVVNKIGLWMWLLALMIILITTTIVSVPICKGLNELNNRVEQLENNTNTDKSETTYELI